MNMTRVMALVTLTVLVSIGSTAAAQQPVLPQSSIEGIVVKTGTNEPIAGADLELSRVEGTSSAPLNPGVAEAFVSILYSTSQGLPAAGATPPPLLAPEVRYGKTGGDGKFIFKDLKEGKYRLVAVRGGGTFYPAEFGQRDLKQRGLNFPLAAGQAKKDLRIEMTPTGVIAGKVVDEDGLPMGHVVVMALIAQFQAGDQRAYIERTVLTDEHGDYRIYWLGPGRYYVAAVYEDPRRRTINMAPTAPPGRTLERYRATSPVITRQVLPDGNVIEEAYGVVYFGGTTDPRAAALVEVRAGETFPGADISMGVGKKATHHIRGVVVRETGEPANGAQILAIPRQYGPNALVLTGRANDKGEFDLAGAFAEAYILTATSFANLTTAGTVTGITPANALLVGYYTDSVGYIALDAGDSDANNIRIVGSSGITVPGTVVIEGKLTTDAAADLAKMNIDFDRDPDLIAMPPPSAQRPPPPPGTPRPAVLPPGNGQVTASGDFKLFVSPGDFRVNVNGIPANAYVKSIQMGGEDVLRTGIHITRSVDKPLQIVIGMDGGTISGSVVDEKLAPFANATVALVPELADQRRRPDVYRNTVTDAAGNFQITTVPPGNYKLFAWDWAESDAWQNASFITSFESLGKPILVSASSKQSGIQVSVIATGKAAK
jgi:hypothetical protein